MKKSKCQLGGEPSNCLIKRKNWQNPEKLHPLPLEYSASKELEEGTEPWETDCSLWPHWACQVNAFLTGTERWGHLPRMELGLRLSPCCHSLRDKGKARPPGPRYLQPGPAPFSLLPSPPSPLLYWSLSMWESLLTPRLGRSLLHIFRVSTACHCILTCGYARGGRGSASLSVISQYP